MVIERLPPAVAGRRRTVQAARVPVNVPPLSHGVGGTTTASALASPAFFGATEPAAGPAQPRIPADAVLRPAGGSVSGPRVKEKTAPWPGSDWAQIRPP